MRTSSSDPPMRRSSSGAKYAPSAATSVETNTPSAMAWTAAALAASGSFSPMRRATVAVAAIAKPSAIANTTVRQVSVRPTVAMALLPRCATQNTSTIPNRDSMHISRTIGTESSTMARSMLPAV